MARTTCNNSDARENTSVRSFQPLTIQTKQKLTRQQQVDDLVLLDGDGVQVDLLDRGDDARLDKSAEFGHCTRRQQHNDAIGDKRKNGNGKKARRSRRKHGWEAKLVGGGWRRATL
jgi:hypothetical protein